MLCAIMLAGRLRAACKTAPIAQICQSQNANSKTSTQPTTQCSTKMCWSTTLNHKCSAPTCATPAFTYKQTIAITPCTNRETLGKHMSWPRGCSQCRNVYGVRNTNPHVTPFDHLVDEEAKALTVTRSICPSCQGKDGVPGLKISKGGQEQQVIQPHELTKIFCEKLEIPEIRPVDLACAIAMILEPMRLQNGLAPHAFTAACVYAASHIAPCPEPLAIDRFIETFALRNRRWFLHAYTSIFAHRHLIEDAGAVRHRAMLGAMPKPCCQRPQTRNCPRVTNKWGFEQDRCTSKQEGGLHVMGA